MILGDFNKLESPSQKIGGNSVIQGEHNFTKWKVDCNLMDVPYHAVNYTWTNNRENEEAIFEWLDRAYCADSWRTTFPEAIIANYPIFISDHGPIILDCHPVCTKKRRPYRIENWCLEHQEIEDIIMKSWQKTYHGSALYKLQRKLGEVNNKCKKIGT